MAGGRGSSCSMRQQQSSKHALIHAAPASAPQLAQSISPPSLHPLSPASTLHHGQTIPPLHAAAPGLPARGHRRHGRPPAAPRPPRPALLERAAAPLPPSRDPFYTAPRGYEHAAPGAVLKTRSAPGLAKIIANCSAAYNLLYRTTDSNYKPASAVTTLYLPGVSATDSGGKGEALLSYQVAYDSASVDSSPSYTFYDASIVDPPIIAGLGLGWHVNVPDYEGPLASFTAGVQSGHATLDSVRAALGFGHDLHSSTRVALSGYSGGALASEWAAELQVQYAPEVGIAGVAVGGLTPNITSVLEAVNSTPFAADLVNGLLGIISQDSAAERYITSQLHASGPYNASSFLAARHQSTTLDSTAYADQNIYNYFASGATVFQNPLIQALVDRDGQMGYHGTPVMPVYAYKAIADELSPVADTDALVARYCSVGANIVYERNTVGGHLAEFRNGLPAMMQFLAQVLEGSYQHAVGCTVRNVTVAIDSSPE